MTHSKTRQKRGAEGTHRLSGQIKVWVGVQRMCVCVCVVGGSGLSPTTRLWVDYHVFNSAYTDAFSSQYFCSGY